MICAEVCLAKRKDNLRESETEEKEGVFAEARSKYEKGAMASPYPSAQILPTSETSEPLNPTLR